MVIRIEIERFEVHNSKTTTTKLRPNLQIDWWDCYTLRVAPVIIMMEISEPQHPTRGGVTYVWQPLPDARIDFSASSSEIFTRIDRERERE